MEKWEYMSVLLEWDDKAEQWKAASPAGTSLRGKNWGSALNVEGEQGWEVVNFAVGEYKLGATDATAGTFYWAVTKWWAGDFRVLLKRRKP